ncbi:AzlC family ABC transporter permease [Peribacillus psychrosaccharolyticus]|uniref:AzlC family ABC transporter permease n=1 Tax=Peribacillus psychrosaccharolyticus TaxID=1407 RepID=A0A974S237_PERPY|nr:AzlC family ABC transporter permease [Peribacillus psychrosaccharolyticus]MEC2054969.1 AzlC family ABC transporter permease [Peribacillus psychrosaccharolyticus]MED3746530.1 AzlC family ABC transporter permease [Peribacillus psychrosaccharolyticus]QQT02113.1 AzlC family ABC transporter permease [Peribacillus psychrosaccharolyticus]
MTEVNIQNESPAFGMGVKAGTGIAIGYAPIAVTYGLLAKTTGLTMGETLLLSMIVYAGAAQYIALNLLVLGTGAIEIILTTFIVNIRHFLLSASLNEKSRKEDSVIKKMIYAFGITDETFSVAAVKPGELTAGYMYGLNVTAYGSWVLFSGIGHLFGASLPQILQESMSVALYAMFIGLLVPTLKGSWKLVFLAAIAASFNCIFIMGDILSNGWAIVASALLSAFLVELLSTLKEKAGVHHE